jgi:molybdopterin-synthase adenylyltransferase
VTEAELGRAILAFSHPAPAPLAFRCAAGPRLEELARTAGIEARRIEIIALEHGVAPEKYRRNFGTFSLADQIRLLSSSACLLGLGGLGGLAMEYLVRAGVGGLLLADGDVFEESNLNRQALASRETLGLSKAEAAVRRVAALNPACAAESWARFVDAGSVADFVRGRDLALDALGGLAMREELARAAGAAGLPLVSAGVAGTTGWVAVVAPGSPCPAGLLAGAAGPGAEALLGTPAPAVGVAASVMAGCALDLLRGARPALWEKMLLFDLADASFETVTI